MNYIDEVVAKQESESTSRPNPGRTFAAALGVALMPAYMYASIARAKLETMHTYPYADICIENTSQITEVLQISEFELFGQLNRIFDYLLTQRAELDDESHRILYSNLWNLYE